MGYLVRKICLISLFIAEKVIKIQYSPLFIADEFLNKNGLILSPGVFIIISNIYKNKF